jgi:hypothetical protein
MYSISVSKPGAKKILKETKDYMEIVEYIITNLSYWTISEKEARKMFYELNTVGKYKLKNGTIIEFKELLF